MNVAQLGEQELIRRMAEMLSSVANPATSTDVLVDAGCTYSHMLSHGPIVYNVPHQCRVVSSVLCTVVDLETDAYC